MKNRHNYALPHADTVDLYNRLPNMLSLQTDVISLEIKLIEIIWLLHNHDVSQHGGSRFNLTEDHKLVTRQSNCD